MPTIALTLPLARRGLTVIPRRDLTLAAGDGVVLQLTIVAADRPDAAPLDLSGIGPRVRLVVWRPALPSPYCGYDYGARYRAAGVFTRDGVVTTGSAGRADISLPAGTTNRWIGRLGWEIQLEFAEVVSVLSHGALHLMPGLALAEEEFPLLADDGFTPVTDDTFTPFEV